MSNETRIQKVLSENGIVSRRKAEELIQLITKNPMTARSISIVSVALGLGYGIGANMAILSHLPQAVQLIFGGSGIVPAALVAIVMNILLPKEAK